MRLTTQGNMGEFVQLVSNKMTYLGPSDLTQYFIRGTEMNLSEDNTEVVVSVNPSLQLIFRVIIPGAGGLGLNLNFIPPLWG